MTVPLKELVGYLDTLLRIREIPDDPAALNGLQVECRGPVGRIVAAVDATQATIDEVVESGRGTGDTTLVLVHHGLFWDGNLPITGRRYSRIKALLDADVALYSAHIPLDLHPEFGNNILLARHLGLDIHGSFGSYKGIDIGIRGRFKAPTPRAEVQSLLAAATGVPPGAVTIIPGGPDLCDKVGIITGAASRQVLEAAEAGLDSFITGEGPHHSYFDATESGVNLFFGGHYATETFGVKALAEHLAGRFGIPAIFHDHPTGL